MITPRRTGFIVAGVTLALALVEPVLHSSFLLYPPEGTVPSFIHTGDSAHHRCAMQSWTNGFYSPYASANAQWGDSSWRYYAVPFFLLYGFFGWLLSPLGLNNFLGLGLLNGTGLALMLYGAYRLLMAMAPQHALRAWLLFALAGGIGGIAWIFAQMDVPWLGQEPVLYRLGMYELLDVQSLRPHALAARLYYTLPLGLGFLGLSRWVKGGAAWPAVLLFAGAAFINPRLGPMFGLVAILRPLATPAVPWRALLTPALGLGVGFVGGVAVLLQHPTYLENVGAIAQDVARPVALGAAALPLWLALGAHMVRSARSPLSAPYGYILFPPLGYLALYAVLYLGHQMYYGTFVLGAGPYGGEAAAAVFASDLALVGVVPGLTIAMWSAAGRGQQGLGWPVLWLLVFLALSISAFAGGWAMRFAPERFLVVLGLPLALLAAKAIDAWRRWLRNAFLFVTLSLGVLSVAGWAYINGPWPGTFRDGGLFTHVRYGLVTLQDKAAFLLSDGGRVAVLSADELRVADMAAGRHGVPVLHAAGTMNISDRRYTETAAREAVLLRAEDPAAMADVVREEEVAFILVSDTAPPPDVDALRARLDALHWLEPVAPLNGVLYRVLPERVPEGVGGGP